MIQDLTNSDSKGNNKKPSDINQTRRGQQETQEKPQCFNTKVWTSLINKHENTI